MCQARVQELYICSLLIPEMTPRGRPYCDPQRDPERRGRLLKVTERQGQGVNSALPLRAAPLRSRWAASVREDAWGRGAGLFGALQERRVVCYPREGHTWTGEPGTVDLEGPESQLRSLDLLLRALQKGEAWSALHFGK